VSRKLKSLLEAVLPAQINSYDSTQANYLRKLTFEYWAVKKLEEEIEKFIGDHDSKKPLVITSSPGGDKSALLASVICKNTDQNTLFVSHFIGANTTSKDLGVLLDGIMRQVLRKLGELDRRSGMELINVSPPQYPEAFGKLGVDNKFWWVINGWANKQTNECCLVIVIDSLDELQNDAYCGRDKQWPHALVLLMRRKENGVSQP